MKRRRKIALYLAGITLLVLWRHVQLPLPSDLPMKTWLITQSYVASGGHNVVTAIYLVYRYYDTLFEALMLLFAIMGVMYLSVHHEEDL